MLAIAAKQSLGGSCLVVSRCLRALTVVLVALFGPAAFGQMMSPEQIPAPPTDEQPPPPADVGLLLGQPLAQETPGACDDGPHCDDGAYHDAYDGGWALQGPPPGYGSGTWLYDWLGTRHSKTHGRAIGPGEPLRGTSWLNRPYEVAMDFGALVMTDRPATNVRSGNDLFAAIHAGWDWDHYWGTQFRVGWSTPELDNTNVANDDKADNLFITDLSVMYYPWGDSRSRPYCRLGMGLTDIEFTNNLSQRQHESLFTIPIALGIKYQFRRWLVWRAEFANNLAIGQNQTNTLNNITLTFGLEGRFGGRPTGYWAWHPRGHAW